MSPISFIYGLGNPGKRFGRTRHNLGWMVVDLLISRCSASWTQVDGGLYRADCTTGALDITLLRSNLYMNNSGEALAVLGNMEPSSLFVICDDMSLPLGRIRIRKRGGSGGHRGLESIIMHLESEEFPRMRLGIGSPPPEIGWTEYVLGEFLDEELETVKKMVSSAADAVEMVVEKGLDAAMQAYNNRQIDEQ